MLSRFPVTFRRTGIRFLDRPAPAEELGLPYDRLTGPVVRTPTGLSRSARPRPGRGGCSLNPGAAVFSRGWLLVTSRRLPFRNGQPCPQH